MQSSDPIHETQVRVRYGEVDRMGVVYHPHYLVFFEKGRTEFLRSLGGTYRELEESGTLLLVAETGVRHLGSARYDDLLTIRTRMTDLRRVRLRFDYEVARGGEVLATGFTVLAAADVNGRLRRLPSAFREQIESCLAVDGGKKRPVAGVEGRTT